MYRSTDTVLGECGDPAEVFLSDHCDNNPLGCYIKYNKPSEKWFEEEGKTDICVVQIADDNEQELFVQKWYEGRFFDHPSEFEQTNFNLEYCPCCDRKEKEKAFLTTKTEEIIEQSLL